MSADPFDYFLLDDDTGELRTAKPLDREALENSTGVLTLIVKARELINGIPGNDKLTVSTAEATVTIKDVNDEPPTFNRREYNIEIPENVPDGTPLPHLDMTVKDPDVVSVLIDFYPVKVVICRTSVPQDTSPLSLPLLLPFSFSIVRSRVGTIQRECGNYTVVYREIKRNPICLVNAR